MNPKIKMLAIDDEAGVREMIHDHFSLRGFEVSTADDGGKGIALAQKIQPEVILLDLKMKQMDGDRALGQIRELAPAAKIFVVSGYQNELARKKIQGFAVEGCFEKPVSLLELEKAIRRALGASEDRQSSS